MNQPKVSIIILNWNGLEDTRACLNSLKQLRYPNYEITLVDNGSKNNEASIIAQEFGETIKLISLEKNLGYTGGNNAALKQVNEESKYILLLNNDTEVEKDFLDLLVNYGEKNESAGILGPKIYYYNKNKLIQSVGGKINYYLGKIKELGHLEEDQGQYQKNNEVDCVPGCALLIKTEIYRKIGLLPEKYFAYWEDTAWCAATKKIGYKIMNIPKAIIYHKEYGSSEKRSDFVDFQLTRNRFWFLKKYASPIQYLIFNIYFWCLKVPLRIIKNQNLKTFFKAIKAGYKP